MPGRPTTALPPTPAATICSCCAGTRLEQFRGLLDGALADAFKSRSMRRKLAGRLRHVTMLVDNAARDTEARSALGT